MLNAILIVIAVLLVVRLVQAHYYQKENIELFNDFATMVGELLDTERK